MTIDGVVFKFISGTDALRQRVVLAAALLHQPRVLIVDEVWDTGTTIAAVIDRVNTTYAVFMGTTMACAQCHTHKYDPLTHREYYQLFDFFNQCKDVNSVAPQLTLGSPEHWLSNAAPVPNDRALLKGESTDIRRQLKVRVVSTFNGRNNKFFSLWERAKEAADETYDEGDPAYWPVRSAEDRWPSMPVWWVTLPPRLILRVIAIRAASICRLVIQPDSSVFSP